MRPPARRTTTALLAVVACLLAEAAGQAAIDLPTWSDEDRQALGSGGPLSGAALFAPLLEEGSDPDAPIGLEKIETLRVEEPTHSPTLIGEEFLGAYFDRRPEQFLLDPQMLLARQERDDQLGFLDYHAGESAIDLYFYLFDRDQELPGEVRAEELAERLFGDGRPAAIVYYYLGAPERSKVFLTSELADVVTAAEQRKGLQSCIEAALDKANPVDQLAGFAVQMSIRLYWMEQTLSPELAHGDPMVSPAQPAMTSAAVHPSPAAALVLWLAPWAWHAGAGAAGLFALLMLRWWLARRRTYRFPALDPPPRLGGLHAAGVGAVISFPNGGRPPTLQRDQMPDYLRRV